MDREQALRHRIRQALDLEFEPAPWLRHRAMEIVRQRRMYPEKEGHRDMDTNSPKLRRVTPWSVALVAVLLGIAVVAGLVAASRSLHAPTHSAVPDSRATYLTAVHEGWGPWRQAFSAAATQCESVVDGKPHEGLCRSDTITLKAQTQHYLDRLAGVRAPTELQERDLTLQQALSAMLPLLDQSVAAVDRGDLSALDSLNLQLERQRVRGVGLAVLAIDCWPKDAVVGEIEVVPSHCAG